VTGVFLSVKLLRTGHSLHITVLYPWCDMGREAWEFFITQGATEQHK